MSCLVSRLSLKKHNRGTCECHQTRHDLSKAFGLLRHLEPGIDPPRSLLLDHGVPVYNFFLTGHSGGFLRHFFNPAANS